MPKNVEIKAQVEDLEAVKKKAVELAGNQGVVLEQEDTFFNVPNGRLKLREIKNGDSVLIQYNRPDQEGPKLSTFHLAPVTDPTSLKTVLAEAMGVKGSVCKTRLLVIYGQTKIHVDDVKGLGHFMELEVMLRDDQSTEDGECIAKDIMEKLKISSDNLIDCAYMDLILKD